MKRLLLAAVLGGLALTALIVPALSWNVAGRPAPVATTVRLSSEQFRVTSVTPLGRQSGLRPGDVYDTRLMSLNQRVLWWSSQARAGTTLILPVVRDGQVRKFKQPYVPFRRSASLSTADLALLASFFLAALVGIFIVARGRGKASLAAGIMLIASSKMLSTGSAAIAPLWLIVAILLIRALSIVVFPAAAFIMAQYCLTETSRTIRTALWTIFAVVTALNAASYAVDYPVFLFAGRSIFNFSLYYEWPIIASLILTLITLGLAAAAPRRKDGAAVRVLFGATMVGFIPMIALLAWQFFATNGATAAPVWWNYIFLVSVIVWLAGYLYAIFASRVYDVDFFISRSIAYSGVIVVVAGVLALAEYLIERAALGRVENTVLSLAAPIAMGLSIRWIGQRAEHIVEQTFYRHKIIAHERLRALAEDFAEAHNADTLAARVTRELHKHFSANAVVYRYEDDGYAPCAAAGIELERLPFIAPDDPVFMRLRRARRPVDTREFETALPFAGLVFPLIVLGRVYGAILAGVRPHEQWYDPDDQTVIAGVAHELGTALLWLRSDALPRNTVLTADL